MIAVGVAVNTSGMDPVERERVIEHIGRVLDLPCVDPVATGVEPILDHLLQCFSSPSQLSATA